MSAAAVLIGSDSNALKADSTRGVTEAVPQRVPQLQAGNGSHALLGRAFSMPRADRQGPASHCRKVNSRLSASCRPAALERPRRGASSGASTMQSFGKNAIGVECFATHIMRVMRSRKHSTPSQRFRSRAGAGTSRHRDVEVASNGGKSRADCKQRAFAARRSSYAF